MDGVRLQTRLELDIVEPRRARIALRVPEAAVAVAPARPDCCGGRRSRWSDRLAALRHGRCAGAPDPGETVRQWLQALGQTPRLITLVVEPLAVAALNQSIDAAAASSFAVVIDRILESRAASRLGPGGGAAAADLYAGARARLFIEAAAAPCAPAGRR